MHNVQNHVSVAVLNGCIYAMEGFSQDDTNQWTLIAPMHKSRRSVGAAVLHGKVSGKTLQTRMSVLQVPVSGL